MINILLFAQLQEEIGSAKLTIEADGLTVELLKQQLADTYHIGHLLDEVMVAINEEYAENNALIKSGDIVALIPPVSGG